jgi:soluble lytic murein transglycosylase-like protein
LQRNLVVVGWRPAKTRTAGDSMKTIWLALTASAFVTSAASPTFAQSTPAETAELATERSSMPIAPMASDPNGPIVVPRNARAAVRTRTTIVATPAVVGTRPYDSMIASHAASNGVPAELVHRVIVRESRYRAGAMGRGGASGLMQIKVATARSMGYRGTAAGLLDPDTNLTYGVRYLAGAYRAANGHHSRAVGYYASGYRGARRPANAYARAPESAVFTTAASAEPVTFVTQEVHRKHRRR